MESLQHIKESNHILYDKLQQNSEKCIVTLKGNILYTGRMTESVYESLMSNKNPEKILVEYIIGDNDIMMTLINNHAIDEAIEEYKKYKVDNNAASWNMLMFLESKLPVLPNIKGSDEFGTIKWLIEAEGNEDVGQSMDSGNDAGNTEDDSANTGDDNGQDMQTSDSDVDMKQDTEQNTDPENALGQKGAEDDEKNKLKKDVKFTIWTSTDEKTTSLKKGEKYLKIEYIYKDKKKGIIIDFLIGKDMKDKKWSLFAGKQGAVSYDDDALKDLKANNLKDAILNAIDEVVDFIKEVEDDKDNWVQFYINI